MGKRSGAKLTNKDLPKEDKAGYKDWRKGGEIAEATRFSSFHCKCEENSGEP